MLPHNKPTPTNKIEIGTRTKTARNVFIVSGKPMKEAAISVILD
jgi:hypothetical protein